MLKPTTYVHVYNFYDLIKVLKEVALENKLITIQLRPFVVRQRLATRPVGHAMSFDSNQLTEARIWKT